MEDLDSIPGVGRSPGEGNGNPLEYQCLGSPMDRGAWRATVYGVTESGTRLSDTCDLMSLEVLPPLPRVILALQVLVACSVISLANCARSEGIHLAVIKGKS